MLFGNQDWPPYVALGFAIISAIVRGARIWAWVSVAGAWVATLSAALSIGVVWHPLRIAAVTLGILVVFGIGEGLRNRHEHLAEYRRTATQRRLSEVQAERVRIARELHDVLAHSLNGHGYGYGYGYHNPVRGAESSLAERFAQGEIDEKEYRARLDVLRTNAPTVG